MRMESDLQTWTRGAPSGGVHGVCMVCAWCAQGSPWPGPPPPWLGWRFHPVPAVTTGSPVPHQCSL